MSKFEKNYHNLLRKCLSQGESCDNRTGVKTLKLFNETINIDLTQGFPIITGKKIFFEKGYFEFKWIYSGRTDLKYLNDNNIFWWDYAAKDGVLNKLYGYQVRNFNGTFDQVGYCINEIKNNSRRALITLWNPCDLAEQALPCCYTQFNFVRINNKLNMSMDFRSSDLFLGLPYDIIVGALFLITIAKECNLEPHILGLNLKDAHIYESHLPQVTEYLSEPIYKLPNLVGDILDNYKSNNLIKTKLII